MLHPCSISSSAWSASSIASMATALSLACAALGCDGSATFPLDLEVKDNAAIAGKKADEIELVVKTVPNTEIRFDGQTRTAGEKPTESFSIPKSKLKLGKNTFEVEATNGVLFSKATKKATASWDAPLRSFVRFHPVASDGERSLSCGGAMCGASTFKVSKDGKLGLDAESALDGTLIVAGKRDPVFSGKRRTFEVDFAGALSALPIAQRDTIAVPIAFEVGGQKSTDTLSLQGPAIEATILKELLRVEQGAVSFAGEAAAPPTPRGIAVLNFSAGPPTKLQVVGKPAKVEELDLVAITKPTERFFACGGGGILYLDLDVKVFERRSGKVVHTRKLMADRVACPPTPKGQVKAEVRETDIARALTELLGKS